MAIIKGVLEEEIDRLVRNIDQYKKKLSNLPKGCIFIRKMGNSFFAYRKYKENGKVISYYLGNVEKDEVQREIELSNEYKRLSNNIKLASKELALLRKAYKAYE